MQVTETKAEGLRREFKIVVPADDIEQQIGSRLRELVRTVQMPGFRPGKVPVSLLRKKYGPSVTGEVLERTVNDSSQRAMSERGLRPAMQPKIEITTFEDGADLEYTMAFELMPEIEPLDFSEIKLEQMVAAADETKVEDTLRRMSKLHGTTEPITANRKSKDGDVLLVDFVGTVDGKEFSGGKAESYLLELGSGGFIPGFEDQLVGVSTGDKVKVEITFPKTYGASDLAGRDASFDVDVRELRENRPAPIDDELATKLGLESLDDLKQSIRETHEHELKAIARSRLKRDLLDALSEAYDFEVPPAMAEKEFQNIWQHFDEQRKRGHPHDHDHDHEHDHDHDSDPDFDDREFAGKSDDEVKEEFRVLAERRVRLGLLFSEIGQSNNIEVTADEVQREMVSEARRHPGREKAVLEYYKKSPEAQQSLRAPLYEDKVVDFILELAQVTDRTVSIEELIKDPDGTDEPVTEAKEPTSRGAKKGK